MDLDLDDLGLDDGPSKAAPRRFQPKSTKLIPKREPLLDALPFTKQEDIQIKPSLDKTITEIDHVIETDEPKESTEEADDQLKPEPMEVDNNEDEVIREINVFFTPPPDNNTQLYVMQYPLRPCWRPYELDERCQEVRVKPQSSKIEVDLSLKVDKNYDNEVDDSLRITKQTLSSWESPLTTSYAVGVLMGNKLHLNPVHAVVQLRPSMEHLKSGGLKKSNGAQNVENQIISNETTEVKSIGLSKKQGRMVRSSAEQVTDPEESWISITYHNKGSELSKVYQEKMASQDSSEIQFSMSPYEYVNSLCPGSSAENGRDKKVSKRFLLSLPLEERFKKCLSEGPQVNRFDKLKQLAPDDSIEDVLEVLQRHACVVQGLWVSRSSLFKLNGGEALARDYVVLLFKSNTVISRTQLDEYKLHEGALSRYLNLFAIYRRSSNDWKFKEPTDVTFIKSHPDIVRKQEEDWEIQEKRVMKALQKKGSGPAMRNSSKPSLNNVPRTSVNAGQVAKTCVNGTPASSTMTLSDETREALPKALDVLLRKHNVCSLQLICQGLREQAVLKSSLPKADARGAVAVAREADTVPSPELHSVISQVAINIHGLYVLKSLGDPTVDPLRRVVIDLFCAKEPKARLKKADIVEAAKIQLKRDISHKEYTQNFRSYSLVYHKHTGQEFSCL